jgi:hypothetical protein
MLCCSGWIKPEFVVPFDEDGKKQYLDKATKSKASIGKSYQEAVGLTTDLATIIRDINAEAEAVAVTPKRQARKDKEPKDKSSTKPRTPRSTKKHTTDDNDGEAVEAAESKKKTPKKDTKDSQPSDKPSRPQTPKAKPSSTSTTPTKKRSSTAAELSGPAKKRGRKDAPDAFYRIDTTSEQATTVANDIVTAMKDDVCLLRLVLLTPTQTGLLIFYLLTSLCFLTPSFYRTPMTR